MNASAADNPSESLAQNVTAPTAATRWFEPRSAPLAIGLLLILTLAAYAPVVRDTFIWDDDAYITHNPTLRSLNGLRLIWLEPLATPQYYPLVHTTFWIEYHLWGLAPLGYHIVNVLLHATSVILLWRLLLRLRLPGAWLAAAIFAVHPVGVESVVWITERKNVLSLALTLASMIAYLRFSPLDGAPDQSAATARPLRWYAASFVLFFLAPLSKTVVSTMPAVLLVITWFKLGRLRWRDIWPLLPFFAIGLLLGAHTARLERTHVGAEGEEWDFSRLDRCLIAGRVVWFYAAKLAWPYPLIFFYHRWHIDDQVWWQYLFPAAALALVVVLWAARRRIGRGPLAAALIFGGVLTPALGFFNVYPFRYSFVADHFQYHASLALVCLAAGGIAALAARLSATWRNALTVATGAILLLLAGLAFRQTFVYENQETLYRDTIAKNNTCVAAYSNLAVVLGGEGRHQEGLELAREAIEIDPLSPVVHNNLGAILLDICYETGERGTQLQEGIREFQKALEISPNHVHSLGNLAAALILDNRPDEAAQYLKRALELNPRNTRALFGMGSLMADLKKPAEAEEYYLKALAQDPDFVQAHYGLGLELMARGQIDEAVRHWETALQLDPRYTDAHYALAGVLSTRGDVATAAEHYRTASELRPHYVAALVNLGVALVHLGDFPGAIQAFEDALETEPDNMDAEYGLALALASAGKPADAAEHFEKILNVDPGRFDVQFLLGNAFIAQNNLSQAIAHFSEAIRLKPDYVEALQNLGAALLVSGKIDEAIPHLAEVLRLQPDNPQARANLDEAHKMQKQKKPD